MLGLTTNGPTVLPVCETMDVQFSASPLQSTAQQTSFFCTRLSHPAMSSDRNCTSIKSMNNRARGSIEENTGEPHWTNSVLISKQGVIKSIRSQKLNETLLNNTLHDNVSERFVRSCFACLAGIVYYDQI